MIRSFLLIFFFSLPLLARENPFFPAKGAQDLTRTTNNPETFDPLKRAAVSLPDSARLIKEVTVRYQNLDGSIGERTISLENRIDWHLPLFVSQNFQASDSIKPPGKAKSSFRNVASFKEIAFDQSGKKMVIRTKDKLLRHFMMIDPHRIVMDFKRNTDFRSKSKRLKSAPYKSIRLGNHDGYYRTVIELDGQYKYRLEEVNGVLTLEVY